MKKMIYFSARSRLQPISVSRRFWILSLLLSSTVHSQSVIWKSAERRLSYDFDDYPQDSGGPHGHYDSYGDWIGANGKHEPQLHAAIPFPTLASRMTGDLPFARFPDSQAGSELAILGNAGLMPNFPCYHATLNHRAIWATLPSPAPAINLIKRSAIKIEKRSGTNYPTEKVKIEIIEFVIPKGFIVSKPYDLVTSFQGGGSAGGNNSYSENVSAVLLPVEIKEVKFAGTNYYELKKDDESVTYSAPHWVDKDANGNPTNTANGEKDYSVAYTRNTNPSVGAVFSIQGLPSNLVIKLRATGSDGIKIPETAAQINGSDVTLPVTASTTNWPNMIKFYDRTDANKAFKLDWEIKVGDSKWAQVASTKHQVYLTLNNPVTALRQETLFYLSAKKADGANAEAAARDSMYGEFTDQVVTRLDGVQMTYWMNNAMGCTDTPDLLSRQDGNGNCQSWGGFFRDMLRIHGITADRIRVWPKAGDSSVIVKDWQFNQPPSGPAQHPYIENLDAFDLAGIPGQGNPNPPGSFNGHWITKSGGHYYDPSYGTAAIKGGNAEKVYEDGAFDGFGEQYSTATGAGTRGIRKNNSGNAAVSEVDYFLAN